MLYGDEEYLRDKHHQTVVYRICRSPWSTNELGSRVCGPEYRMLHIIPVLEICYICYPCLTVDECPRVTVDGCLQGDGRRMSVAVPSRTGTAHSDGGLRTCTVCR